MFIALDRETIIFQHSFSIFEKRKKICEILSLSANIPSINFRVLQSIIKWPSHVTLINLYDKERCYNTHVQILMHSKIRNQDYDFTAFEEHIAKL